MDSKPTTLGPSEPLRNSDTDGAEQACLACKPVSSAKIRRSEHHRFEAIWLGEIVGAVEQLNPAGAAGALAAAEVVDAHVELAGRRQQADPPEGLACGGRAIDPRSLEDHLNGPCRRVGLSGALLANQSLSTPSDALSNPEYGRESRTIIFVRSHVEHRTTLRDAYRASTIYVEP